jgi:hypothetical protein
MPLTLGRDRRALTLDRCRILPPGGFIAYAVLSSALKLIDGLLRVSRATLASAIGSENLSAPSPGSGVGVQNNSGWSPLQEALECHDPERTAERLQRGLPRHHTLICRFPAGPSEPQSTMAATNKCLAQILHGAGRLRSRFANERQVNHG